MDQFVWKEVFNIGVADIDRQHREFLEMLNNCQTDCVAATGPGIDQPILDKLKQYAVTHFRSEEKMMAQNSYPEIQKQQRMHAYFESQVTTMANSREEISPNSMFTFMREWFLKHIMEEDIKFAKYLKG